MRFNKLKKHSFTFIPVSSSIRRHWWLSTVGPQESHSTSVSRHLFLVMDSVMTTSVVELELANPLVLASRLEHT